ncbi:MAG: hypothetical protein EA376_09070 [Phycisphaeraceae bacterium]|nr:MAG: hypothetical protein EA376_09070 [Phycisphaeraceae bacterium]
MDDRADQHGKADRMTGEDFGLEAHGGKAPDASEIYELAPPELDEAPRRPEPAPTETHSPMPSGDVITEERNCHSCGYDLRGLHIGGVCPECGVEILPPRKKVMVRDTLVDAPIPFIAIFHFGFMLLTIGASAIVVAPIAMWLGSSEVGLLLLRLGSLTWLTGLIILCRPRPKPPELGEEPRDSPVWVGVMYAALVTQAIGVIALWLPLVLPTFTTGALIGVGIGVVGLAPTVLWLARLAEWVPDADRAHRMRVLITLVVIAGPLTVLGPMSTTILGFFLGSMSLFALLAGLGYFLWSLFDLTRSAGWAVSNARLLARRRIELREQVERASAEAERERYQNEPFGGPI